MNCKKCEYTFKLSELDPHQLQVESGNYAGQDFIQVKIDCPSCEEEMKWGRIQESDLIEADL